MYMWWNWRQKYSNVKIIFSFPSLIWKDNIDTGLGLTYFFVTFSNMPPVFPHISVSFLHHVVHTPELFWHTISLFRIFSQHNNAWKYTIDLFTSRLYIYATACFDPNGSSLGANFVWNAVLITNMDPYFEVIFFWQCLVIIRSSESNLKLNNKIMILTSKYNLK
jgi:hypothetical protein